MSMPSFLIAAGVIDAFVSDVIVCFPSSRMRAAVFINLVNMRRAVSSPDNPCVGLTPHNLDQFQKANYLFHSAHNCILVEVCLVCFCLQKLVRGRVFKTVRCAMMWWTFFCEVPSL